MILYDWLLLENMGEMPIYLLYNVFTVGQLLEETGNMRNKVQLSLT